MGKQEDVSVQLEALDILSDMLGRLSGALVSFHSALLSSLLPQLTSSRMAVRKRSILALGHLVPCCSPALFSQLTEHLTNELAKAPPVSMARTYIQCLATVSRQGGHRVVNPDGVEVHGRGGRRAERLSKGDVATVTKLCLKFMTFDPNYNYDDEEEEEDSMDVEEGLEEESDDEYSDDDDMSWKVRRSSIKCLESLIATRRDLLLSFFSSVCPALLARFKEREENVRADVFSAFSSLLRQTRGGTSLQGNMRPGGEEPALTLLKTQLSKGDVATVTKLCLKFMTFDPNYNYDDEEEEEDSMDVEEGLEEESDDEYSDDDDMSWKVRRSSIKCLESLIATRRDLLLSFFSSVCPALLARFKEREENVRADVFSAFSSLLRQTRGGTSLQGNMRPGGEEPALTLLKTQLSKGDVATVTKLCLKFMTFDPNYNYDGEEEEEDSMDVEEDRPVLHPAGDALSFGIFPPKERASSEARDAGLSHLDHHASGCKHQTCRAGTGPERAAGSGG
ncbi:cullin-associated NEDD8-dissociated protein 1-like isoform X2 [Trematomus bernacchii]|uniref:cullin-associated NEDD8-dissociated protein 1-like isoform X2 n=1 Tax=Trematomus bernacchii TaxID=40690 RepID=UPI00146C4C14|nr:cullin-associated NEDD8-dissociated protein 1-like isoform X2 [Trematomus bernacchii]